MKLSVGNKEVRLIESAPRTRAATSLAYVPAGPHVLHRRHAVRRRRIRASGPARCRTGSRPATRCCHGTSTTVVPGHGAAHRQEPACAAVPATISSTPRGVAQALRRRHEVRAGRRRHLAGTVGDCARGRAAADQCLRPATASSATTRRSARSSPVHPDGMLASRMGQRALAQAAHRAERSVKLVTFARQTARATSARSWRTAAIADFTASPEPAFPRHAVADRGGPAGARRRARSSQPIRR